MSSASNIALYLACLSAPSIFTSGVRPQALNAAQTDSEINPDLKLGLISYVL